MSEHQDPIETLLRRMLLHQRAGTSIADEAKEGPLRELFEALEADLRRLDPTGVAPRYREGRRRRFMQIAAQRIREFATQYESLVKGGLAEFGRHQAEHARDGLIATLGAVGEEAVQNTPVTQQRIRAILNTQPFQGRTLREATRRIGASTLDRVAVQVRLGMLDEEPIGDIVRRVRGRKIRGAAGGFAGGVWEATTRDSEAIVRTAVTFISNEGMLETYRANQDVVAAVEFVSVLDSRTTDICLALSGSTWPVGSPDIVVPGEGTHIGCRSSLVPQMDWQGLGMDPPPQGERAIRDTSTISTEDLRRPVSARRRASGSSRTQTLGRATTTPTSRTAAEWFRKQPARVQNAMVGKGRAELFRAGEIDLKDLITRDRTSVPLRDLLEN